MKPLPRHLSLSVRRAKRSATLAINERSAELQRQGHKIFRLGLGQSPFPVPEFVVQALRDNAHQKDYLPVSGLGRLREAVSDYHNRRDGLQSTADDVLIGPGSKELLFLAQMCYSGELIVPSPSWVSYEPQASLLGLPTCRVPTSVESGWRLEAEALRAVCQNDPTRPRLLILNYPNNPAGTTLNPERLQAIAKVCAEFQILVISDEIYGEVHHDGKHVSLAKFYPEGTVISGGLSKWCGAGGWRLGTFLFPRTLHWLREAMSVVASETFTSVAAPIQWAAVRAFQDSSERDDYLRRSRKVLKAIGRAVCSRLRASGLELPEPEGGFYLFADASPLKEKLHERGIRDSISLAETLLLETGVAVLPGSEFGRPPEELTLRLATVNFDGVRALQAIDGSSAGTEDFVRNHAPDLWEATERLCTWLKIGTPAGKL